MKYDADQLDLFVSPPPEPEEPRTFYFYVACLLHGVSLLRPAPAHRRGARRGRPGRALGRRGKCCYVAHCTHLRKHHPERAGHLTDLGDVDQ